MRFRRFVFYIAAAAFLVLFAQSLRAEYGAFRAAEGSRLSRARQALRASEETISQDIPLRYGAYELGGAFYRLTGRREVEQIYRLGDGNLVKRNSRADLTAPVEGMCALRDFCQARGVQVLYVSLPFKTYRDDLLADRGIESFACENAARMLDALAAEGIPTLDAAAQLLPMCEDPLELFYRTDHHWKASTGLACSRLLVRELNERFSLGLEEEALGEERLSTVLYERFWLGEFGKKLGAPYSGLDDFELIRPRGDTHLRLVIPSRRMEREGDFSILLKQSNLELGYWERRYGPSLYYTYLFGNDPLQIIENRDRTRGDVLIVRDSFAQTVLPFLALTARSVTAWDMRFNSDSLYEYIDAHRPDTVVVMYTPSMLHPSGERDTFDFH